MDFKDADHVEAIHQTHAGIDKHGETVAETRIHESRMEAALLEERPFAWRKSFLKLYACIFVGYLCSATNGFDANTFGMEDHSCPPQLSH